MGSKENSIRQEAGYIWDTCMVILSKHYTGQLDDRTKDLVRNMGSAAQNLIDILGYDFDGDDEYE